MSESVTVRNTGILLKERAVGHLHAFVSHRNWNGETTGDDIDRFVHVGGGTQHMQGVNGSWDGDETVDPPFR